MIEQLKNMTIGEIQKIEEIYNKLPENKWIDINQNVKSVN